jgi:hypothetical protein
MGCVDVSRLQGSRTLNLGRGLLGSAIGGLSAITLEMQFSDKY